MSETTLNIKMSISPEASQNFERYVAQDFVHPSALPEVFHFEPTGDTDQLYFKLGLYGVERAARSRVSKGRIDAFMPKHVTHWDELGINAAQRHDDAMEQEGDRFRNIIRWGNSFDTYKQQMSVQELEAFAVGTGGLDASLTSHGNEQARRMFDLMTTNQYVHVAFSNDMYRRFGNSRATLDAYGALRGKIPYFDRTDIVDGVNCGGTHDYGEAKIGVDKPLGKKDAAYEHFERSECYKFVKELHTPWGDSRLMRLLEERFRARRDPNGEVAREYYDEIGAYLHPEEISRALYGTEAQTHANVPKGNAFSPTIERLEYILENIRSLEAVEHNFNGINYDPQLQRNIMRLGVDTPIRSLRTLARQAERYPYVYGFLRTNEAVIDRYLTIVDNDIQMRAENPRCEGHFGVDPFAKYNEGDGHAEGRTIDEAKADFRSTVKLWRQWKRKQHLGRMLWETYIGTERFPVAKQTDVSFLQYTAAQLAARPESSGKSKPHLVLVEKPVIDWHGHSPLAAVA